jgi:MFS transporter, FSR family, fosmidomycin resistance protein
LTVGAPAAHHGAMPRRELRVNVLISMGHTLSHFYVLCLPPLFISWQRDFGVSFAELGLAVVVMSIMSALLQTPIGFLVDRYGARPFLIGGTLLMSLAISGMAFATHYWQIVALATISGTGNAAFHPSDYSILAGSIAKERIGRAFALHSFTGNLGFAVAPPVVAGLMLFMGWREALFILGLLGLPVACGVIWQSAILQDETRRDKKKENRLTVRDLLFDRTMFLFFMFYLLGAMAGSGVQAWLITVLHQVKGIEIEIASAALTSYLLGSASGVLIGGWATDHAKTHRHLSTFVIALTSISAVTTLLVGIAPVGGLVAMAMMFFSGLCLGGSRTPRDVMLKDAAPAGEIGKVFGYISASLPLGSALVPVPFGLLIDHGHPEYVLVVAAVLLAGSLLCMGSAKASIRDRAAPAPAE